MDTNRLGTPLVAAVSLLVSLVDCSKGREFLAALRAHRYCTLIAATKNWQRKKLGRF